jgi:hypothetical protein
MIVRRLRAGFPVAARLYARVVLRFGEDRRHTRHSTCFSVSGPSQPELLFSPPGAPSLSLAFLLAWEQNSLRYCILLFFQKPLLGNMDLPLTQMSQIDG